MKFLRSPVTAAVLGGVSWTAAEYGLHRFAMHVLRGRGLASREHLQHHADVRYFSPTSKKLLSAAATTAVVAPVTTALAGRKWSAAFTSGMITTYFAYEVAHRRVHTHPPRNRYGRWARRSHLHHHFGAPMQNFGVTTPVWDQVFGTYEDPGVVTVPLRMAPDWMLDEAGRVHAEFSEDYVVKAGARSGDAALREQDRDDAFANRVPVF